jgi:hypothetical protein
MENLKIEGKHGWLGSLRMDGKLRRDLKDDE